MGLEGGERRGKHGNGVMKPLGLCHDTVGWVMALDMRQNIINHAA